MSLFNPPQVPVNLGLPPQGIQGARMAGPILLAFQASNGVTPTPTISDDLIIEGEDGTINNIQAIYFDNSQNNGSVFFTIGDTLQTLVFPPKSWGYMPILATNSLRYSAFAFGTTNVGQFNCLISFLNIPVQPIIWSNVPGSYQSRMLTNSNSNTTGAAVNIGLLGLVLNKTAFIHGFDVGMSSATAESQITISLTNLASGSEGASQSLGFLATVPVAGGLNFTRRFDPPFRVVTAAAVGGFNSANALLEIPAAPTGVTSVSGIIYYSID
jgi:hypothetical protein